MRIRTVMVCLCGAFLTLVLARPAAAQGAKIDFAGGYQYFRFIEDGAEHVPNGWGASFAAGNEWIKAVGDVGGHYKDGAQLHTFQGGLELSGKKARVVPFVRVLSGVGVFSGFGMSDSVFVFTPEGGVKIMVNDTVGVQTSVGFPIMFNEGESAKSFRLFAGVVIRK